MPMQRSATLKQWHVKQYPPPLGGLNTDWPSDSIGDHQLQMVENLDIDEIGILKSRPGVSKVNSVAVETGEEILSLYGFYDEINGARDFLVQCNQKLYTMNLTTGNKTQIATGLTKAAFRWYTFAAKAYAANGTLYSWDGSTWGAVSGAPSCKGMTVNLDKMFAWGDPSHPSWLYYSASFDPDTWNSADVVRIREEDTGKIVDVVTIEGNIILVGKTTSTFAVYGADFWDIAKEQKTDTLGCIGRTMVEYEGAAIWLSNQGLCFWHPELGFKIFSLHKCNREILANTKADLNNAVGRFWPKERKYILSIWSASTPKIYVFDFKIADEDGNLLHPATVYTGITASAIHTLDGSLDNGELYIGTNDSFVKKFTGNTDDGSAITGKARWKYDDFRDQIKSEAIRLNKDPRDVTFTAQASGPLTIKLNADFGRITEQENSPSYTQAGVAKFDGTSTQFDGTKLFASSERLQIHETKFSQIHGRKIAIEVQRQDTTEFKIHPPAIEYQVRRS